MSLTPDLFWSETDSRRPGKHCFHSLAPKIKLIATVFVSNEVFECKVRYLLLPGDSHQDRKSKSERKNKSSAMCLELRNLLVTSFSDGWGTYCPNPSSLPFYDLCHDPLVLAIRRKCSCFHSSPKTSLSKLESYLLSWEEDRILRQDFGGHLSPLDILKTCHLIL